MLEKLSKILEEVLFLKRLSNNIGIYIEDIDSDIFDNIKLITDLFEKVQIGDIRIFDLLLNLILSTGKHYSRAKIVLISQISEIFIFEDLLPKYSNNIYYYCSIVFLDIMHFFLLLQSKAF